MFAIRIIKENAFKSFKWERRSLRLETAEAGGLKSIFYAVEGICLEYNVMKII